MGWRGEKVFFNGKQIVIVVAQMSEQLCTEFRDLIKGENPESTDEPKVSQAARARHLKSAPRIERVATKQWDATEIAILLARWTEVTGSPMERAEKILPELPGRTPASIYQKFWGIRTSYKRIRITKRSRQYVRPAAMDTKMQEARAQAKQANGNDSACRFWKHLEKLYNLDAGADMSVTRGTPK